MINIVVFSKDRACQLDLFLASMSYCYKEFGSSVINVLYTYSNLEFKYGYEKVKQSFPNVKFIMEQDFKKQLLNLIKPNNHLTTFFVDDDVWRYKFTLSQRECLYFINNNNILCLSLRLDSRLHYCYALDIEMLLPQFSSENCWKWKQGNGDFGYPMSLDGHIFRTDDIWPLLNDLEYKCPNTLEGVMANHPINKEYMMCLGSSAIFNIPMNRVQNTNQNRSANIDEALLNQLYLNGFTLDATKFYKYPNKACHEEVIINY